METDKLLAAVIVAAISFALNLMVILTKALHKSRSMRQADQRAIQASHSTPAPRVGGLAIFIAIAVGIWVWTRAEFNQTGVILALSAIPVFAAGLLEDLRFKVSPFHRLLMAAVSSVIVLSLLEARVDRADIPGLDALLGYAPFAVVVTVLAASGYCHALNLVDGMNGLGATTGILSSVGLHVIALQTDQPGIAALTVVLAAALWGFLVLNWPNGRVFLGDAGSYTLGHLIVWSGILLLFRDRDVAVFSVLLVLFWPFAETLLTIARRIGAGRAVGQPDKRHFHQMVRRGIEIIWFGRNRRNISNPVTTLILLPFIASPVIAGVWLWNRPNLAMLAFFLHAAAFVAAYYLWTRFILGYKSNRDASLAQRSAQ